jgi:hypothetical protein
MNKKPVYVAFANKKIEQDFEKETMDLIKVPTEEYLSFSRALRW